MKQLCQLFVSLLLLFITISSSAQEAVKDTSYWKKASQFGLNFNQGSFSSNWAGGGVNSIALGVILNSKAEYKKAKNSWTNDFQFQFGSLWTKAQNDWRKSADRLFLDSKYAHQISPKWNLYANINFLSQIAVGYKFGKAADGRETITKISNLFAPAYFTQALGFEYKPVSYFSLQLSPLSMRQIIVADKNIYKTVPTNYGVEVGKTVKNELGLFQLAADYNKNLKKDANLKWRYQAFVPYGQNFGSVDNRLDAQLTAKFAKYFNFNIGFIGMYFQSQSTQIQISQTMGIGFLYAW